MATKTAIKTKKPEPRDTRPGKGVAVQEKAGLPADMDKIMMRDAGKGVSAKPEDNLVPMMAILQDKTPEADRHHQRYIEGAEGGMIWLKNSPEPFVPGEDGILVQHCHSYKALVEWKPRNNGGGFMGQHPWSQDPSSVIEDAKQVPDPRDPANKMMWVRKNGNEIIDTRYEVVRVFRDVNRLQYVIPFTSTGHTVAKGWNTLRGQFHLSDGQVAPTFSRLYRLTTKAKTNAKGTWFLFNVDDEGWVKSREDYEAGLALFNSFNRGEKEGDTSTLQQPDEDAESRPRNSGRM